MKIKVIKVIIYIFLFYIIFSNVYGTYTKNVIVGEVEGIDNKKEESVYDVEISWDNMKFTYNETKDIKWDNNENKYSIVTENEWINEDNKIEIKNFSDKSIIVKLEYKKLRNDIDIIGKFDKEKVAIGKNKKEEVTFNISGKIRSSVDEYIKVGRITINVQ